MARISNLDFMEWIVQYDKYRKGYRTFSVTDTVIYTVTALPILFSRFPLLKSAA